MATEFGAKCTFHAVHCTAVTKPEKQDGTMELNVDQIDLLDLALPSEPKPAPEEEPRVSKGPPPLPLSMPPMPIMEEPAPPAAPAISARTLVAAPPPPANQLVRFLVGMGGATALCAVAFFVFRAVHKPHIAPPPPVIPTATAEPTHAFTMAPIEFTAPVSSGPEPESASATTPAPPPHTNAQGHSTAPTQTGTARPHSHPDDVIKVEN